MSFFLFYQRFSNGKLIKNKMKYFIITKNIGLLLFFSILLTACVNHISEENEAIIADGNIPLKL